MIIIFLYLHTRIKKSTKEYKRQKGVQKTKRSTKDKKEYKRQKGVRSSTKDKKEYEVVHFFVNLQKGA